MNDRDKIRKAFVELRKRGWFARQSFMCCQGCGCNSVPDKCKNKFVFYHKQDAEHIRGGDIDNTYGLWMSHGEGGNGFEIVAILNKWGLDADWDGNMNKRIFVKHKEVCEQ